VEAASAVCHSEAARTPAGRGGHDFAIGGDTLLLEAPWSVVHHPRQIHLLRLMMLARAMGRERSRQLTQVRRVR
jgi:hypothetical protein